MRSTLGSIGLGSGLKLHLLPVDSVSESSYLAHGDAEGGGDGLDGAPSRVGVAALDQGEGAGCDLGRMGQIFLGDAALLAKLADRFA